MSTPASIRLAAGVVLSCARCDRFGPMHRGACSSAAPVRAVKHRVRRPAPPAAGALIDAPAFFDARARQAPDLV